MLTLNIDYSLEGGGRKEGEMMVKNQLFKRLAFLMSGRAWGLPWQLGCASPHPHDQGRGRPFSLGLPSSDRRWACQCTSCTQQGPTCRGLGVLTCEMGRGAGGGSLDISLQTVLK